MNISIHIGKWWWFNRHLYRRGKSISTNEKYFWNHWKCIFCDGYHYQNGNKKKPEVLIIGGDIKQTRYAIVNNIKIQLEKINGS